MKLALIKQFIELSEKYISNKKANIKYTDFALMSDYSHSLDIF